MPSGLNASTSQNYPVAVSQDGFSPSMLGEPVGVNTGDTVTFHNKGTSTVNLVIDRALLGTAAQPGPLAPDRECVLTVAAPDDGLSYDVVLGSNGANAPFTAIKLTIKMGGHH
jgi:hypothetical protein